MFKYILAIFLFLLLAFNVQAQRYNFKSYNVPDGLVNSTVSSICEDQNGYIWFGTYDGGLSRFDGITFQNFTDRNGLPSNRIQAIFSDQNGVLWIGTEDAGMVKYDGLQFTKYGIEEGMLSNSITSIISDDKNRLWIGTAKGLNIYDNDSLYAFEKNNQLTNNHVLSLMKVNTGSIWIGTPNGIATYIDHVIDSITVADGLVDKYIKAMIQDSRGDIWVGTPRGLGKISDGVHESFIHEGGAEKNYVEEIEEDKLGQVWVGTLGGGAFVYKNGRFKHITDKNGLNSNAIISITRDSNGVLWLGTVGGGVNKHNGDRFVHFGKEEGLSHDLVFPIMEDRDKNIWMGTYGGGINKYDPKSGKIHSYNRSDGLSGDNVFSIMESKKGVLWAGTMKGLNKFDGKRFRQHPKYNDVEIWSLFEEEDGTVWVGTHNGVIEEKNLERSMSRPAKFWKNASVKNSASSEFGVGDDQSISTYYSKTNGFTNSSVLTITKDLEGNMWFGTDLDGIFKFDGKQFKNYNTSSGLTSNYIMNSMLDKFGAMWFGTDKGLAVIIDEKVRVFTEDDGLSSNTVNSVLIDNEGNIWIGGTKGIDKIQFDQNYKIVDIVSYGEQEGFTGIETNEVSGLKDSNGNLWFGTIKGVTRLNPEDAFQTSYSTKVHISKVKLFFDEVDWSQFSEDLTPWFNLPVDLKLESNQNQLTFDFIGINMKTPDKIQYQWKLEGFDKEWSPANKKRDANYTNLPAGAYNFIVRATNEVGIWSPFPASFTFSIAAPIWQRWWFVTLASMFFVSLIWGFLTYRLNNIKKEAITQGEILDIERKMIESERKALRAQINPHFIFNVLNSIQFYIQDNEPLIASKHLSKFAKLMRMILENSKSSAVLLSVELESLKLYMDLEILRTEYKFDYVINIDETVDEYECMIPPMLIQPFIENSIRHGLIPSDNRGRIILDLKLKDDIITCSIEDNGIGINAAKKNKETNGHVSSGMQITEDRLEILNMQRNHKKNIHILDLEEAGDGKHGTRVEIFIPLEN